MIGEYLLATYCLTSVFVSSVGTLICFLKVDSYDKDTKGFKSCIIHHLALNYSLANDIKIAGMIILHVLISPFTFPYITLSFIVNILYLPIKLLSRLFVKIFGKN